MNELTLKELKILSYFVSNPSDVYGLQLMDYFGIASGSVYPVLQKFERLGLLSLSLEESHHAEGRRPRRYYSLIDFDYAMTLLSPHKEHLESIWETF